VRTFKLEVWSCCQFPHTIKSLTFSLS